MSCIQNKEKDEEPITLHLKEEINDGLMALRRTKNKLKKDEERSDECSLESCVHRSPAEEASKEVEEELESS
ncbi:hypothetical protein KIN20_013206 [Parelaphostrongylus tenuis]|uniref:Uncharacterized protein n=1 Tax=Parelaphostrongylus tenuis TaxID=148309 RepID=A0AAD5QNM1_PARTN|nr:hypothetical protein KIN20_013206 [Parelaphostrongylus tenuis]